MIVGRSVALLFAATLSVSCGASSKPWPEMAKTEVRAPTLSGLHVSVGPTNQAQESRAFATVLARAIGGSGMTVVGDSEPADLYLSVSSSELHDSDYGGKVVKIWSAVIGFVKVGSPWSASAAACGLFDSAYPPPTGAGTRNGTFLVEWKPGQGDDDLAARYIVNSLVTCPTFASDATALIEMKKHQATPVAAPPPMSPPRTSAADWVASQKQGFAAMVTAADLVDQAYVAISDVPIEKVSSQKGELGNSITAARDAVRRTKSYGSVLDCGSLAEIEIPSSAKQIERHGDYDRKEFDIPMPQRSVVLRVSIEVRVAHPVLDNEPARRKPNGARLMSSRGRTLANLACGKGLEDAKAYLKLDWKGDEEDNRCNHNDGDEGVLRDHSCITSPFVYLAEGDTIDVAKIAATIKR
jgi:hypothetical protein